MVSAIDVLTPEYTIWHGNKSQPVRTQPVFVVFQVYRTAYIESEGIDVMSH